MSTVSSFHLRENIMFVIFIFILQTLYIIQSTQCQSEIYPSPIKKVKFQMPPNYDKEMRPAAFGEAVNVEYDIHVQAINPIKAADMDFRMEMLMSQQWVDLRLNFSDNMFFDNDFIILPLEFIDMIWHPDPYIVNAKSIDVGQLTQKLEKVYIFRNQTITFSTNMFVTVACSMQFQYYPFDFQICPMIIESFSYDESRVKYKWSKTDAFTINPKLRLLQFQVTYPLLYDETTTSRVKAAKNYSQLIAYFRFDRLLGNHLIQTFAPCSLIVCLSWCSFWLGLDAISARVSLLVTAMLTLVTQFGGLKPDFPPVAYVKAVDIWMAGCMLFVFAALGEFTAVKVIYIVTEEAQTKAAALAAAENNLTAADQFTDTNPPLPTPSASSPATFQSKKLSGPRRFVFPTEEVTPKFSPMETQTPIPYALQAKRLTSAVLPIKNLALGGPDVRIVVWKRFDIGIPLVWTNSKTHIRTTLWKAIDDFSRWMFPLTFCIFLCVYWIFLFIHSRLNLPGASQKVIV